MPTKKTTKKKTTKKVAKKATKKKVVKKAVAKKSTKKTEKKTVKKTAKKSPKKNSKKSLVYANDNTSFWVTNGQILNSLIALKDAMDEMEKEVYEYHANGWQNDFATWVESVLKDAACAKDLHKAKTPRSAKTVVVKHLKLYTL